MIRLVTAETRRILREPLAIVLTLLLAVTAAVTTFAFQEVSHSNLGNVRAEIERLTPEGCEREAAEIPPGSGIDADAMLEQCLAELPMYQKQYRAIESNFTADADFAALAQHPLGAPVWAFGLMASLPGLLALALLSARVVAREWSRGTITPVLLYEQRLGRLLAARALALWLWAAGTALVMTLAVWLLAVLFTRGAYPLDGEAPLDEVLSAAGRRAGAGLLVLLLACALLVTLAALVRSPLRTALLGAVLLALCLWSVSQTLDPWLPGRLVADAMGFEPHYATLDHMWQPSGGSEVSLLLRALPALTVMAAASAWGIRVRRRSLL
ncbi:ABC transporter permease subunit [Streptomyces sp. HB2AG]|nr:ABC transporter permease subunit [Streptomyces sp. HB2AG]